MSAATYQRIIKRFKDKHLLVLGDLVLDQYIKGSVSRISPEAPVPVVLQKESFYTPGGAANVGNNLSSLGAKVTMVGKIGDDIEGEILKRELKKRRIGINGIFVDKRVDTIFKTRIIAQHQQVVRLDRERVIDNGFDEFQGGVVWPFVRKNFNSFDGVIISDYGKGMIGEELVAKVCALANERGVPITVDPKVEHFQTYGTVTSITPNRKEAENALKNIGLEQKKALGIVSATLDSPKTIEAAGNGLLDYLKIDSLLITLGEDGMYLFERGKKAFPIPTRAQEVFDVSGAGDTVISVFTLALAAGATKRQAADLSNYAAGVVVGKMGAVAITTAELIKAVKETK